MKIEKLGLQVYSVRDTMGDAQGIRMSFKKIKSLGYDIIQTAGCQIPYAEYAKIAKEEGLEICGTHENFAELCKDPEKAMENHKILGTTNIGIGGYRVETLEDIEQFIEKANRFADTIYEKGFKFTYHNHSYEFKRFSNGKTMMEMLIEGLDPEKTSFVLDTYWVQHAGGDVCYWIEKLAGRIDILHLKGMGVQNNDPYITEIGADNMNWKDILETAEKAGVKYYVVEQDTCPGDAFDSIGLSSSYLHKNFM